MQETDISKFNNLQLPLDISVVQNTTTYSAVYSHPGGFHVGVFPRNEILRCRRSLVGVIVFE